MEFQFSPEEEMFRSTVRRYAEDSLQPNYSRWEEEPLPRQKVREFGGLGLLGLRVPARYGGQDASFVAEGIATEEVARCDFNFTYFIQIHAIMAEALAIGSPSMQGEWLPPLASGEKVASFGLTEPGMGSDASSIKTHAYRDGDDYLIDGEKGSISFAGFADFCLLFARTGGEGAQGVSAFVIPLDLPGVTRIVYRSPGSKLTQRGSLFFDKVRVPAGALLGQEGKGFYQAMSAFDFNRAIIGLACLGAAQKSLEETIQYAKERSAFGKPISKYQGVSFQIAEHLTMIEAARLMCYKALWLRDQGMPHTKEAAMAKWLAPDVADRAIRSCIILHGHYGYNKDLPLEQRLRDVLGLEIGDGTPEIMKLIVARQTIGRAYTD